MSQIFAGVDVSKKELSITVIINHKNYYYNINNNQKGFEEFSKQLKLHKVEKIKACMESTGIYGLAFANYLFSQNHEISIVNPVCISAFAKSKLSRHKTDKVDSKVIAEYASKYELKPYQPADQVTIELKSLHSCIQNLENQYRKVQNYLETRELMAPTVITVYEDLSSSLRKEIAKLEQKIDDLLDNTPSLKKDLDNIQTIPGIDKKTAISIMSSVANINLFAGARQLAAFAGLTPRDYQSGSSIKKRSRISKMGTPVLRKALYFPAMSAMQHNSSMKDFANKLKSKGKCGKVIVIAVMRKLLHIIFGIIKHKKPYDACLAR